MLPAACEHGFASVEGVIEGFGQDRIVLVCDNDDREAESDLMAAGLVDPENVAFTSSIEAREDVTPGSPPLTVTAPSGWRSVNSEKRKFEAQAREGGRDV